MRKIYVLLIFCLLILSLFVGCDNNKQGSNLVMVTLDSGVLGKEAETIDAVGDKSIILPSGEDLWKTEAYTFSGWSTSKDGEVKYKAGDKYTSSSNTTLYAVWSENKVTITYSSNGGNGTISSVSVAMGTEVTLDNGSSLSRDGFIIHSWNTSSDGEGTTYELGDKLKLTKDITLYAVWTENYNIKFYSGDTLVAIEYPQGGSSIVVGDGNGLSKDGYALYWVEINPDGSEVSYDIGEKYTGTKNASLYARWQKDDGMLVYDLDEEDKTYSVKASETTISGEIDIPSIYKQKKVTSIANSAFDECSSITKITIPDSITTIPDYAFANCTDLTSIYMPESVTLIGTYAFYGCEKLTSISIPETVTSIRAYAFLECKSLTSISIPNSVITIAESTFEGCSGLTSISIPDSITTIPNYAFAGCKGLTSISIPGTVISIGTWAFSECSSLKELSIPSSVTSIGSYAFSDCSALESIYIDNIEGAEKAPKDTYDDNWGADSVTVYWTGNYSVDASGVLTVKDKSKVGSNVVIPDKVGGISVTSIGSQAFYECYKEGQMVSVTIPDGVTTIESYAFSRCWNLETVNMPKSVKTIGQGAFNACDKLTLVTLPENLEVIGKGAFSFCEKLESISIPKTVSVIGEQAFITCTALKSVVLSEGLTTIGSYAFEGSGLTSIEIPSSVTSIGDNAFERCTELTTIKYLSTMANWETLVKNSTNWNTGASITTVKCTDGDITISGEAPSIMEW